MGKPCASCGGPTYCPSCESKAWDEIDTAKAISSGQPTQTVFIAGVIDVKGQVYCQGWEKPPHKTEEETFARIAEDSENIAGESMNIEWTGARYFRAQLVVPIPANTPLTATPISTQFGNEVDDG